MLFGLTNAPATFQLLMNEIFRNYLRKFVLVFFDDILVYSLTTKEHRDYLRRVLQVLADHHLYANEMCMFGQRELKYLGHVILVYGVAADEFKVVVMRDWPRPMSIKELGDS